jgi:hypothetical protein
MNFLGHKRSTPAALSPSPCTKMNAALLDGSTGDDDEGGMRRGGMRSLNAIVDSVWELAFHRDTL